jgi:hypothetical protein
LAVGVLWWSGSWYSEASIAGAITLAIGIGIQNFELLQQCRCKNGNE